MKNKYEICKFYAFDHEGIEEYLREKALEGWKVVAIYGTYIKFRKSEPEELNYSVEFIPYRFIKWQDSEEARNVKTRYKEKDWDFIHEWEDFLIFSSKRNEKPIKITEEEKFKKIAKISAKEFLKLTFLILWIGFLVMNGLFINMNPYTITNNLIVIMALVAMLTSINIIIDFIRYIVFFIKAKKCLKRDGKIEYSSINKIKRKRIIDKVFIILYICALLIVIIDLKELGVISAGIIAITIFIVFIASKWKGKNKEVIMVIAGVLSAAIIVVGLTSIPMATIDKNNKDVEINLSGDDLGLQIDKESVRIDESKGILGNYIDYSDSVIDYQILESKYSWLINFYFERKVEEFKKVYASLEFKRVENYDGYKIVNDGNYFIINALNKVIVVRCFDDVEESKIISLVEEKLIG